MTSRRTAPPDPTPIEKMLSKPEWLLRKAAAWTIDGLMIDACKAEAVLEWTMFRIKSGRRLRGVDWYVFDRATGLIAEVRAYYAADEHRGQATHELGGFDYAKRGYPMTAPKRHVLPAE